MAENLLDKIIAAVSPEAALRRREARAKLEMLDEIKGSGYGNHGASRNKKSLKGWTPGGGSAYEDIHDNLNDLRIRSRDLYMGVPIACGALKTYRTNVVGSGLTVKPTIDSEAIGLSQEQAEKLEATITREFDLWADSKNCDSERLNTFYTLQKLAFLNWLQSGDVLAMLQMKERAGTPYQTCVLLIEADRLCTPGNYGGIETGTKIVSGVEFGNGGEVVAYHIARHHPLTLREGFLQEWDRVEAFGEKTGRRNVLHLMEMERIGQRRGVPILAPVIESMKQLGRYTDAELVAAVVNGLFTVFIEREAASEEKPLGEITPPDEELVDEQDENSIEMGSGNIVDLEPGEKAKSETPGRPNANFSGFVEAICKQIGTALELPYEVLMKQFTSSYSASRAALLEAWKGFSMWRDEMIDQFCQPVYEEWFSEAVALGRIKAPGFFADPAIRKAYTTAQWYGPTQGQLDPVAEVQAANLRVECGFSNRAKEAMELTGTDLTDNIRQIGRENQMMKEAGMKHEEEIVRRSDQ